MLGFLSCFYWNLAIFTQTQCRFNASPCS